MLYKGVGNNQVIFQWCVLYKRSWPNLVDLIYTYFNDADDKLEFYGSSSEKFSVSLKKLFLGFSR